MARRLPPFASVRAFEAAARHCSFKHAGKELALTPSAISHQVKSLEGYFGHLLFFRQRSNLVLTDAGQEYMQDLTKILDALEAATERALSQQDKSDLTINLTPSLASHWLVSRIQSLRDEHPDINVRLITSLVPLDFRNMEIDFSVQYLKLDDTDKLVKQGYQANLLFSETIIPVCSPEYLKSEGPFHRTADIMSHSLIFCETEPDEWPRWCKTVEIPYTDPTHKFGLDTRALALKAAVNGLGIAMGRTPFHFDDLAKGTLVSPAPFEIATGYGFYLIYPERKARMKNMRKFREWILKTSAGARVPHSSDVIGNFAGPSD